MMPAQNATDARPATRATAQRAGLLSLLTLAIYDSLLL